MAGAVYIKGVAVTNYKRAVVKDTDEWPSKYSKLFVELDDGLEFSFTDKRRFAKVRLLENPLSVPPISELGPDALLEPMTLDEFFSCLSKKKTGIKAILLDQGFMSGIGNWMADEVLYQAKIHPQQIASTMPKETCGALLNCINEVTKLAVEVDADSLRFPVEWLFHYRWGKKPGKVNGKKIEFINAGGRTTAYVPQLQKLAGHQAVKEDVKKSKVTTSDGDGNDGDELENEDKPVVPAVVPKVKKQARAKNLAKDEGDDVDPVPSKVSRAGRKPSREGKKNQKKGKKAVHVKRNQGETDDEEDNSSGSDDENEVEETDVANGGEQAKPAASSNKKAASNVKRQKKARN